MGARRFLLAFLVLWFDGSWAGPSTDYALVARWPVASQEYPISATRPISLGAQRMYLLGRAVSNAPGLPAGTVVDALLAYGIDRSLIWSADLPGVGAIAVAADASERVFVLGGGGKLAAYDVDGGQAWVVENAGSDFTDLALSAESVFVRTASRVLVYDKLSGAKITEWGSSGTGNGLPGELVGGGSLAVDGETVFASVHGHLVGGAIDAYSSTGQFLRRVDTSLGSGLVASGGSLYVGGAASYFRVSVLANSAQPSSQTLQILFRNGVGSASGAIAVRGDRIYIPSRNTANKPEILEYRQSSAFVPADDAPAYPQPYLVSQSVRSGQTILDLGYRVDDPDSASVQTALLVNLGAGSYVMNWRRPLTLIEGSAARLGVVASNTLHSIAWDFGQDFSASGDVVDLSVEVLAIDDRGLLGVGLVSIPAGIPEGSSSALAITGIALRRKDFLDAYAWLFASGDPAVEMVDGQLLGTAASGFGGVALALDRPPIGPDVTEDGVAYLLAREGLRRATPDEVLRGRHGATPGQTNRFTPVNGSGVRPAFVNEYGIETTEDIDLIYAVSDP